MTKKDFVEKYAKKTGLSRKAAVEYIDAFLETVEEAVVSDKGVQFVGFGNFEVKETAARKGRNPKTGEEIMIPAKNVVKFKVGKKLREMV